MSSDTFTIGQVAESAGIHVETIRYYQRQALVDAPAKPLGGIRRYDERFIARLRFIKRAQQLGFSLDEVRELLQLDDGQHCRDARLLAERKLVNVEAKLKDLRTMHRHLKTLVTRCQTARGTVGCPLIESLANRQQF
jgi:MerR family mercuric resistance operon transcriptional regulator